MNLKRVGIVVGVLFVLFFVIAQPRGAADLVLSVLYILRDAANSVVLFIRTLF